MKKVTRFIIIFIISYCIVSAMFILFQIDFKPINPVGVVGMGYKSRDNFIRNFMGLPSTYTTDGKVSPIYLLESLVKVVISFLLMKVLQKTKIKQVDLLINIIISLVLILLIILIGYDVLEGLNIL